MANKRLGAAMLAAALALAGCATEKKVKASSEVIYEEATDAGTAQASAPADPFEGCEARQQPPATILACGPVAAAFIEFPQSLNAVQIEQNFKSFEDSFPQQSTRERFTQKLGDEDALGSRVYENSPVAPFRMDMLIVPLGDRGTRILSCRVTGSLEWTRCGKITEQLAANGIPSRLSGGGTPTPDTATGDGGAAMPRSERVDGSSTPTGPR
jgi:hypothetical protein